MHVLLIFVLSPLVQHLWHNRPSRWDELGREQLEYLPITSVAYPLETHTQCLWHKIPNVLLSFPQLQLQFHKLKSFQDSHDNPEVVAYVYNLNIWEVESRGLLWVQAQPEIHQTKPTYKDSISKKKNPTNQPHMPIYTHISYKTILRRWEYFIK